METDDGIYEKVTEDNSEKTPGIEMGKNSINNYNETPDSNYNFKAKNNYESNPEKPFYELINTNSEPKTDKNCCLYISSCYDMFEPNNDKQIFLVKSLFILLIQFIIIFIFILLGFISGINEAFIKSSKTMWGSFIPTTVIMFLMCYSYLRIPSEGRSSNWLYLYLVLYIPCITFYCFLLSKFCNYKYIICGVLLYNMDILSFILTIKCYDEIEAKYCPFLILSSLITIIILVLFHYLLINDTVITIKISSVGLSEIIYIIIIIEITISRVEVEEYLFEAVIFNLGIFTPVAYLVLIAVCIFLYGVAESNNS
jgi:hypothetical protein